MTNVDNFERSDNFYNFNNYKKVKVLCKQSATR